MVIQTLSLLSPLHCILSAPPIRYKRLYLVSVSFCWFQEGESEHFGGLQITSLLREFTVQLWKNLLSSAVIRLFWRPQLNFWTGLQHHGQHIGKTGRCRFFTDLATFRQRWYKCKFCFFCNGSYNLKNRIYCDFKLSLKYKSFNKTNI